MNTLETKPGLGLKAKVLDYLNKNLSTSSISMHTVVNIFIPLLVDQIILSLLNIFNSSMVSSSGEYAVSAVSMVDSLNLFFNNFYMAIATGATVVVAQYIGRRDVKSAGRTVAQATMSSAGVAAILGVTVIIFSGPMLSLLFGNAEKPVFDNGYIYLIGCCISYPFFAVVQTVLGSLRGMGQTKASMVISIFMNGLYVLVNFILINFFHLGVLGLAISIVLCRSLTAVLSLIYLLRTRVELAIQAKHFFTLDVQLQKSILFIGLPAGTEQIFFNGGKILTQTFIVALGTASMAANAIGGSVTTLFYIVGNAMQLSAITVMGQCVGAGQPEEGRFLLRNMNKICIMLSTGIIVLLLPFTPILLKMYHASPAVETAVMQLVLISVVFIPLSWAQSFITPAALRAAGDAVYTTVVALITMWTFRVVMGYVFGIVLGLDIQGVYLAMVLEWVIRGIVFSLRLRGNRWYRHNFIN